MKKILLIIAIIYSVNAQAQFTYSNQWAVTAAAGVSDNLGYDVQVGFDKTFGLSVHGIQTRVMFLGLKAKHDKGMLNYQRYAIHCNYAFSFDQIIPSSWFFLNMTAGVVGGYDNIPDRISETVAVTSKSGFIVGLNVAPQLEFKIAKNIHLYAEPRFSYLFLHTVQNYDFTANFGIKIYL